METNFESQLFLLSEQELEQFNGGEITFYGIWDAICCGATSAAAGCIASSFFPAGAASYLAAGVVASLGVYLWNNF